MRITKLSQAFGRRKVSENRPPFTSHWRSRQRERVVIDHDPFTSRARPGGVFGSAFPCALPLLFLCARTRRACKTAPRWAIGEVNAFPLVVGSGGPRWGEPSWRAAFGVAGLSARRFVAAICRHPDLRARRPATPNEACHPETKLLQPQQWQIITFLVEDAIHKNAIGRHAVKNEVVANRQETVLVRPTRQSID